MGSLNDEVVRRRLAELGGGWAIRDGKLYKEFEFEDFAEAFAFMTKLAGVAEESNHHPDWSNSYNHVTISLYTHDQQGLTDKDFSFARAASQFAV